MGFFIMHYTAVNFKHRVSTGVVEETENPTQTN
jgi:hypothetical protein